MSADEGCWEAWFDGLAEAIRRGPPQPAERLRTDSAGPVDAPRPVAPVVDGGWQTCGVLYNDERPQ